MTDGYVKLWRKLLEWPLWHSMTGDQAKTMITILLMADWKQNGRLVSSQRKIAEKAGVSHKVVRNTEQLLEQDHGDGPFLKIDRAQLGAHRLSIYTVCNYKRYQPQPGERGTEEGTSGVEDVPSGPQGCALGALNTLYEESEEHTARSIPTEAVLLPLPSKPPKKSTKKTLSQKQVAADTLGREYARYLWEQRSIRAAVAETDTGRRVAFRLLDVACNDQARAVEMIHRFVDLEDPYLRTKGWSWHLLPSRLNELQAPAPRQRVPELLT